MTENLKVSTIRGPLRSDRLAVQCINAIAGKRKSGPRTAGNQGLGLGNRALQVKAARREDQSLRVVFQHIHEIDVLAVTPGFGQSRRSSGEPDERASIVAAIGGWPFQADDPRTLLRE
jgi:hypothetical protein